MLAYKNFLKEYNKNGTNAIYVLHQTDCNNCQNFIKNNFQKLKNLDDNLTLVKVNMDDPSDVKDLQKIINVSDSPNFPVLFISTGGIFEHVETPTMASVRKRLKKMTSASGVEKKSLRELQNLLVSNRHKKYITPLGSSVNIAVDHGQNDQLVDLRSVFARNSVVLFKWDNCPACKRVAPEFKALRDSSRFSDNVGFYTVDIDHHEPAKTLLLEMSKIHKLPDNLLDYADRGSVPHIALFTGHSYPQILSGRKNEELKKELEDALQKGFVNIKKPSERKKFDDIKSKNSVVLFIDWKHSPCLKTLNTLRNAVEDIEDIDVYAFNVRNNPDLWSFICKKYKKDHNVRLKIETIPQIIYFFEGDLIPRLKINVDKMSVSNLVMDIKKQYPKSSIQTSLLRNDTEHKYFNKSSLSDFRGGTDIMSGGQTFASNIETAHQNLLDLANKVNEFSQKVTDQLAKLNATFSKLRH